MKRQLIGTAVRGGGALTVHVATVYTSSEVRFTAAATSGAELNSQLAAYVARRAADLLWADDAVMVRGLLSGGRAGAAVELYFSRVGERWDEERLDVRVVRVKTP